MFLQDPMEPARRQQNIAGSRHEPISVQGLLDNRDSFDRSGDPARILFHTKTVHGSSQWSDVPREMAQIFRRAFVSKSSVMGLDIDGETVVVDFHRMLLIKETGCGRSIAWIDVEGKCFFPREPVHCSCCWGEGIGRVARELDRPWRRPPQVPDLNLSPPEEVDDQNNGHR